jgi:hypothetical protein
LAAVFLCLLSVFSWSIRVLWLLSEVEGLDQVAIPLDIVIPEIVEEPPPLADEHEEPAPGMVVLLVDLEMIGEVVDPLGQDGHLDIRRAGIGLVPLELFDDLLLFLCMESHFSFLLVSICVVFFPLSSKGTLVP